MPLAVTGDKTGTVGYRDLMTGALDNPGRREVPTGDNYVLAAHIRGKVTVSPADAEDPFAGAKGKKPEPPRPKQSTINVVLVADADMLSQIFFRLREEADAIPGLGIHFNFDNVAFVLNALDSLAGDNRFIEVRKRRPKYRTLTRIEQWTAEDRKKALDLVEKNQKAVDEEDQAEQKGMEEELEKLKQRKDIDPQQLLIDVFAKKAELEPEEERQARPGPPRGGTRLASEIETELKQRVDAAQGWAKWMAVLLPPIPPLAIALVVFLTRRVREREGVARSRLR